LIPKRRQNLRRSLRKLKFQKQSPRKMIRIRMRVTLKEEQTVPPNLLPRKRGRNESGKRLTKKLRKR
jgi:hypothetical protein